MEFDFEAAGEGGKLLNSLSERFMEEYAPNAMELASRDVVARASSRDLRTRGWSRKDAVYIDLVHLGKEKIMERLPES